MMKFSPVSLLFASTLALALACLPSPTLAQHKGSHGGGSHGGGSHGGGSHGGGSHGGGHFHSGGGGHISRGGGGSHGGSSRGGGRSHIGGGGRSSRGSSGSHSSSGAHGGGGGHYAGGNSRGGVPARPTPRSGGARNATPAFDRRGGPASSRPSGTRGASVGDGQWHSFGSRGNSSVATARGPSTSAGDGQWHSFRSRGDSAATAARGPSSTWQGGAAKSWNGQGHQTSPNRFGSGAFAHGEAPRGTPNRGLPGSGARFSEHSSRTTGSAISSSRVVSNIDHSRFGNSATNQFSFSNSRFGSHVARFERREFGDRHEFRGGESNFGFGQESSFGGDAFSFFPDLLGLALAFGSFGARGFGIPGFGLPGLALNLLESGFGDFGNGSGYGGGFGGDSSYDGSGGYYAYGVCPWTPGPISLYWGPGVMAYPADNLACPR